MVFKHLKLLKEYAKISLASAMEYRGSFLMQTVTMIVNDAIWIVFWWIFFSKFTQVNGWELNEMIMLYAVLTFSFGLAGFFFGNRNKLANLIADGKLDFYLSLPKNELFHALVSKSSWYMMGDIIFGLVMAALSFSLVQWPLFILLSLISMTIWISFGVLVGSLGFFFGQAEETSRHLFMGLVGFSSYPLVVFKGAARILLLTVIPAGFVSSIPVDLLRSFSLKWFLLTLGFAILLLAIAVIVFRIGLRRYESGSMITVRV